MQAMRLIKKIHDNGILNIQLPKAFGQQVEVIILPVLDEEKTIHHETTEEEDIFLASAYHAVIEDDKEEDAIWGKYINADKS